MNGQPLLCFCGLCQDLTGPFLQAFLLSVASGLQSTPSGLLSLLGGECSHSHCHREGN